MQENKNFCPHCQAEMKKGEYLCPMCGIDIREWNPDKMKCPVCRSMYPQGTKFCLNDGSKLEPAVVDFDTEATMFLSGSAASGPQQKDDIIPSLKFAEEPERVIPKRDRDESGKLKPPSSEKQDDDEDVEVIMPDINYDPSEGPAPHTEKSSSILKDQPRPEVKKPKPAPKKEEPIERVPSMPKVKAPPKKSPNEYKIKPLEEYERILQEEEEKEKKLKMAKQKSSRLVQKVHKKKKRGFFGRLKEALKIFVGK